MTSYTDASQFAGLILLSHSLCFFVPLWGPRAVFGKPPILTTPNPALPAFSTADFLVLVGLLSVANAILSVLRDDGSKTWLVFLFVAANGLVVLVWIRGLRFMRQRSIERPPQRLLFQVVLHPLSVVGPTGIVTSGIMLVSAFEHGFERGIYMASVGALALSLLVTLATKRLYHRMCATE